MRRHHRDMMSRFWCWRVAEKPRVRKKGEPDGSESRMAKKPEAERMAEKPNVGEERSSNEPDG